MWKWRWELEGHAPIKERSWDDSQVLNSHQRMNYLVRWEVIEVMFKAKSATSFLDGSQNRMCLLGDGVLFLSLSILKWDLLIGEIRKLIKLPGKHTDRSGKKAGIHVIPGSIGCTAIVMKFVCWLTSWMIVIDWIDHLIHFINLSFIGVASQKWIKFVRFLPDCHEFYPQKH